MKKNYNDEIDKELKRCFQTTIHIGLQPVIEHNREFDLISILKREFLSICCFPSLEMSEAGHTSRLMSQSNSSSHFLPETQNHYFEEIL